MKKTLLCIATFLSSLSAVAIGPDLFNHLGLGVGAGTTGISVEAATPITSFVQMRAGVSYMPSIKFNADADFDYTVSDVTQSGEVELKGDLDRIQGHVIFNVYPIPKKSFYIAAGAYFGGDKLLKITGHCDELAGLPNDNGYVTIGDYRIPVDEDGNVSGGLKVKSFRPYFGLGFGRTVPGRLLSFNTELGVQIHGKPQLYTDYGQLDNSLVEDDDTFQKIINNLKVYPTLTFRLCFRAF